jgi:gamma-glutamyltranspeptidase/glutathione hydrolase
MHLKTVASVLTLHLTLFGIAAVRAQPFSIVAKNGVVVSVDRLASQTGLNILKKGGHAVDAAVAAAFMLAVTTPQAGNIGGGGFMVVHLSNGETATLDFREKAPVSAHARMFYRSDGQLDSFAADYGYLVAGIPGTIRGLEAAWKKYGRLKWRELIEPAYTAARKGHSVTTLTGQTLSQEAPILRQFPAVRQIFFKNDSPVRAGNWLRQDDLATILGQVADSGSAIFYEGSLGARMADKMQEMGGLWTCEDLKNYQAVWRPAVHGTYRGYEIVGMGPPSSGGITLIQMLNIFENGPADRNSGDVLHRIVETMRLAYFDRERYLADGDFVDVPTERLLSKSYAREQYRKTLTRRASSFDSTAVIIRESVETTHVSIIDKDGNAVAMTVTIEDNFGSHAILPGFGFFLNSEMHDFNIRPDVPNHQGGFDGNPNLVEPGKRMLSSMAPTIVLKDGKPFLITGSPGGRTIINTVLQVIIGVVDDRLTLRDAIDYPRLSHTWLPDEVRMETKWTIGRVDCLLVRHHRIKPVDFIGDAHSIWIDPDSGMYYGEADRRRQGFAAGY